MAASSSRAARHWLPVLLLSCASLSALPARSQVVPRAVGNSVHVVRPGDTLWDLARHYMSTPIRWPEIQRDNAVPVPERLRPGQVLALGAIATVADVAGEVFFNRGDSPWEPLNPGTALQPGDVLSTGRNAFLTVALGDGSKVVIPSSSTVRLLVAHNRATRLELLNGRVESHVEKQKEREFEIRTKTFALGVKGTHFRVRSESETETVEVLEGAVAAMPIAGNESDATLVSSGQGATLKAGQEVDNRKLLAAPQQMSSVERRVVRSNEVDGAAAYQLQLARDPEFLQLVAESMDVAPSFRLPSELPQGFYHTRLSAMDAQKIEGLPGTGLVYAPRASSAETRGARRLSDDSYEIRWTPLQGRSHTFQLSLNPDFSTLLLNVAGDFPEGVTVQHLEQPAKYYWRCLEEADAGVLHSVEGGSFEVSSR